MTLTMEAAALMALPYPVWIYDRESLAFLLVNDAAVERYGYTREQFANMTLLDIRPREDRPRLRQLIDGLESGNADGPWRHVTASRETIYVDTIGSDIEYGGYAARLVVVIDVTQRVHVERRLEYLAHNDPLTGLPNRTTITDVLANIILERSHLDTAVMFIDFEGFKAIHDALGQGIADEVLRRTARRLMESVPQAPTVARWSDDQFVVLIPYFDDVEAVRRAVASVVRNFRRPFEVQSRALHIIPAIGVSLYPNDASVAEELIRKAETAMYASLGSAQRIEFFAPAMEEAAEKRLEIENDLRAALERDELMLHVQPIYDATLARIISVEALLRWNHPQRGLLMPNAFIDLAEETGLIVNVGSFVINEAARIGREWRDFGIDVPIAVNVSARQLHEADFIADLTTSLLLHRLPPEFIEIELTESGVMKDANRALSAIHELRAMGVRVAIDDFGTGYNSMLHLKRLPVSSLKIDRAFIREMLINQFDFAMVEAMVGLGRRLNLHIVAEGIETAKQAEVMEKLGATGMQGYHMARPMAPEKFLEFYARHQLKG